MSGIKFNQFNPKENEPKVLEYWKEKNTLEKINIRNQNGDNFFFLQGPPYTSGSLHTGHGWNHALKDAVLRYKRMNGYSVLARAGYDMHGLPTELKVQKKLNLKDKEDIKTFGYDNFIQECLTWSEETSTKMTKDLQNLGVTLDFSDPYKPISQEYIDSVWFLIKEADKKGRLYLGEKTMMWCPETESALAKHEVEYKEIKDTSVFLKFKKEGTDNEYFIIWTTTPWTIPFNLAIMVNPDMEYLDAIIKLEDGTQEIWTICKDLANMFLGNVDGISFEMGKPYLGNVLEGKKYIHPWAKDNSDIQALEKKHPKLFTVLLSTEYVDASAGSGLVHCAPGCGPEDYEVGLRNGLPPYNTIDEKGIFPSTVPKFAGFVAKKDDAKFIKLMEQEGFLVKRSIIEHEYPHAERSKAPVVFRTTKQWFFKIEDLKEKMLEFNKNIYWHPQTAKNAFNSWLDNLRDNSITKQRIWGTPAPIWVHTNEKGTIDEYFVVGSREQLESLAGKLPENLHKPWIDSITFKSPKTGNLLQRIPDVLDVWIDAGCASWATLHYPKRKDLFEKYFPADYIVEGKDQIRGWYNLLMVAGILALEKPVFKNVSMHGFLAGIDGVKMSKSLGNIISPQEIIDKTSIDTFRYYFTKTKAGEDIAFSWDELALHHRHLTILWNTAKYFTDQLAAQEDISLDDLETIGKNNLDTIEKYIISKANHTINTVTELFERYKVDEVPDAIAQLFLALSRNYIQAIRDKINGTKEERAAVLYTLREVLQIIIKLFSPICPFITEMIYQNITHTLTNISESVHEQNWPIAKKELIVPSIEEDVDQAFSIITGILAARELAQQNVRQPLGKTIIITTDANIRRVAENLSPMITGLTNIKELDVVEAFDKLTYTIKPVYKELGFDFGVETADTATAIQKIKNAREIYELLKKQGSATIQGKTILPKHVTFDLSVEKPFYSTEIPGAIIAIDSELSDELVAEGIAREFTRRVQQERKNLGFIKKDRVNVLIDNQQIFAIIKPHIDTVKDICGAKNIEYSENIEGNTQTIKGTSYKMLVKRG